MPNTLVDLKQYQQGTIMDRLGLMARRNEMLRGQRQPRGLAGYKKARPSDQPIDPANPQNKWASVASRLWAKAIPAKVEVAPGVFSFATPGEGIVGYGDLPVSITRKIGADRPILGWDPQKLAPDERFLLNHLVSMRQKEADEAEKNYPQDPQMMAQLQEEE